MNPSFRKMFWGFLFVLVEIHILVIDLLPDPVGYYMVFLGLKPLVDHYGTGEKAKTLAVILIVISIPTFFLQQTVNVNEYQQVFNFSPFSLYMVLLEILKLILVFYIFQLFVTIVKEFRDESLIKRTSLTLKIYIIVMFILALFQSFSMNLTSDVLLPLSVAVIVLGLIMEVCFLLLIRKIGKHVLETPPVDSGRFIDTIS